MEIVKDNRLQSEELKKRPGGWVTSCTLVPKEEITDLEKQFFEPFKKGHYFQTKVKILEEVVGSALITINQSGRLTAIVSVEALKWDDAKDLVPVLERDTKVIGKYLPTGVSLKTEAKYDNQMTLADQVDYNEGLVELQKEINELSRKG